MKIQIIVIMLIAMAHTVLAQDTPQRPFPQRGFDTGLMVELFTMSGSGNNTAPGTPRTMDMAILHQFARNIVNAQGVTASPRGANNSLLFNAAGHSGTNSVFIVDPATWNDPEGFRMLHLHSAGTGGVAHTNRSYRVVVCESMGYGMLMIPLLAGSEDINLGATFGNRTMREVLLAGLPTPLRAYFTANPNDTGTGPDGLPRRLISFQTYYDALFRSVRYWPTANVDWSSGRAGSSTTFPNSNTINANRYRDFSANPTSVPNRRSYQFGWSMHHVWNGPPRDNNAQVQSGNFGNQLISDRSPGHFQREGGISGPQREGNTVTHFTGGSSGSPSTATDGTMDIAYSLILASEQWGDSPAWDPLHRYAKTPGFTYYEWARRMVDEIFAVTVHHSGRVTPASDAGYHLTIGNWAGPNSATGRLSRPSDHMMQHLEAFAAINPERNWRRVINATYDSHRFVRELVDSSHAAALNGTGLMPDFIRLNHNASTSRPDGTGNVWLVPNIGGQPAQFHETASDGAVHWNACRVPWRIGNGILFTGHSPHEDITIRRMNDWHVSQGSSPNFNNVRGRWLTGALNGTVGNGSNAFQGPMLVPAAIYGPQNWFNSGWNRAVGNPSPTSTTFNNYGDYINILAMISASGNDWTPVGRSLTVNGGTTANGFTHIRRVVAGAKVPLRAPAEGFTEWTLSTGVQFWPGYDGTTRNTYIRMPADRNVIAAVIPALTGTATIDNTNPRIGDVLIGSLLDGNNTGTLAYRWLADDEQVQTGASATYTVSVGDRDKVISLEITSSVETGARLSSATAAVLKALGPDAPFAPTELSKTSNSITLNTIDGAWYRQGTTGTWQDSPAFSGLSPSTGYTFYAYFPETDFYNASPSSETSKVITTLCEHNYELENCDICDDGTSIRDVEKGAGDGIRFVNNPARGVAEIHVAEGTITAVVVYDALGNVVHDGVEASWDLRNTAGRLVAEGAYLVIVETRDRNGRTQRHSARLGVKR